MGKFIPSQHVEGMTYDFTEYKGGIEGTIPEPSNGRVKGYFKGVKNLMGEVRELRELAQGKDMEDLSDEEMTEMLAKVDEATEGVERLQEQMTHWIAFLCGGEWVESKEGEPYVEGGSPSVEQLQLLPFRVSQAFTQWLNEEIQPKRRTPGSKR